MNKKVLRRTTHKGMTLKNKTSSLFFLFLTASIFAFGIFTYYFKGSILLSHKINKESLEPLIVSSPDEEGQPVFFEYRVPFPHIFVEAESFRVASFSTLKLFEDETQINFGNIHMNASFRKSHGENVQSHTFRDRKNKNTFRAVGYGDTYHFNDHYIPFSLGSTLFLSTSDNTDPRLNGRTYTIKVPLRFHPLLLLFLGSLFFLSLYIYCRNDNWQLPEALYLSFWQQVCLFSVVIAIGFFHYEHFHDIYSERLIGAHYFRQKDGIPKHYSFYGGRVVQYMDSYKSIHREALPSYFNFLKLDRDTFQKYDKHDKSAIDRLGSNYFVYLIYRLVPIDLNFHEATHLSNVLLWLMTILFGGLYAARAFQDSLCGWIAAILLTGNTTILLMLHSVKIQYAGSVFFIAFAFYYEYLYQEAWKKTGLSDKIFSFLTIFALYFTAFYFSGGWFFVTLYIIGRLLWQHSISSLLSTIPALGALVLAKFTSGLLDDAQYFVRVSEKLDLGKILNDTVVYIQTFLQGGDVTNLRFLNYPHYRFFEYWPYTITASIYDFDTIIALFAVAAAITFPQARKVFFLACIMAACHAPVFLTNWEYAYGYLSLPSVILLSIAASLLLAKLVRAPKMPLKIVGTFFIFSSVLIGIAKHRTEDRASLANFYGFYEFYKQNKIRVYYDDVAVNK